MNPLDIFIGAILGFAAAYLALINRVAQAEVQRDEAEQACHLAHKRVSQLLDERYHNRTHGQRPN